MKACSKDMKGKMKDDKKMKDMPKKKGVHEVSEKRIKEYANKKKK